MKTYLYQDNLEGPRILTRKLTIDDAKLWAGFFEDKDATAFLPDLGIPSSYERAKYWVERQLSRYADKRFGLQALIDKETKQFVGQCGLLAQAVDGQNEIEVGYHVFKKHWGQGYAPEAAKLFIDYAFQNDLADSVISIIDIHNIKSQRVADKNRLTREKQTNWSGLDVFIYRINK